MSRLQWDATGTKKYYTGTDRGVLYPMNNGEYGNGVPWQGITAVNESPSGAEETALWADNQKYGSLYSKEEFGYSITAYDCPEEFDECDGTVEVADGVTIGAQDRKSFGFSYRTLIGNDTQKTDYGYKVHLVYGSTASVSEKSHSTVNDSPEAEELSWDCTTIPVPVTGFKPTAHLIINSLKCPEAKLKIIEDILYGTDAAEAVDPVYAEFTGDSFAQGTTYYERSGTEGSYTYTATEDTTMSGSKTYYTQTSAGSAAVNATTARLPLPDEVISIIGTTV
jgi:hypothetical protein